MFFKILLIILPIFYLSEIYNISFTTLEGEQKSISKWQGKKIMIVILPISQAAKDSTFLLKLDSISKSIENPITIIGIASIEDGFTNTSKSSLVTWYRHYMGNQIIISDGMETRKISPNQHDLFKWLTHMDKNGHFDNDVLNVCQRFFINEQGELYSIISPQISLTGKAMKLALR